MSTNIPVVVKWGKATYNIEVNTAESVAVLKVVFHASHGAFEMELNLRRLLMLERLYRQRRFACSDSAGEPHECAA